jgi:integrase
VCSQVGKRASQGPGTISGKITTGLFTPCWYLSIGQFQLSAGWRYTTTRADGEDYKKARLAVAPAGTVKKEWNILQAILNRAVMLDRIKANPLKGMKGVKEPKGRIRYLKADERERLLKALTTPSYLWSIALVAILTGLRRGNIVDLQWSQIDFDARIITIQRTKNDEPLVVPLNKSAMAVLQALPRTDECVFPVSTATWSPSRNS